MKNKGTLKSLAALFTLLLLFSLLPGTFAAKAADGGSSSGIIYRDFPFGGMVTQSLNWNGNNRLTKSIEWTPTNPQMIQAGKTCRLDLNGYILTIKSLSGGAANAAFFVNGGTLIIEDSSEAQTGKIVVDSASSVGLNVIGVYNGGSVMMTGGTLECAKDGLYPLYLNAGSVDISGGRILSANDKSAACLYAGSFALSSGAIQSAGASAIEGNNGASVTVSGGNVVYPKTSAFISPMHTSYPQSVSVSGGTFSSKVPKEYCAAGYAPTDEDVNGNYTVCKHENIKAVAEKAADCTENGNIAYWHCLDCGRYFSDASLCNGVAQNGTVIPAAGHSLTGIGAKAATCTDTGYEAYWVCRVCHKLFSDENGAREIAGPIVLPLIEHSFGAWTVTIQPTETEKGEQQRSCSLCNAVERSELPPLGHKHIFDNSKWTGDDTCHWHACVGCAEKKDLAAHVCDAGEVTKPATETAPGEKTFRCAVCGMVLKIVETPSIVASAPNVPKTGDSSNAPIWFALALLAAVGMAASLRRFKRRREG